MPWKKITLCLTLAIVVLAGLLPAPAAQASAAGSAAAVACAAATAAVPVIGSALGAVCPFLESWGKEFLTDVVLAFVASINGVGYIIIYLTSLALGKLLGEGRFITSSYVAYGWPIVQGLANLGFIIALLFIALATTLRLEMGNPKKLLPRLLLAALLINFSLVIGGVLIDTSRILMAVLARSLGNCQLSNIGICIIEKSPLLNQINLIIQSKAGLIPQAILDKIKDDALPTGWDIIPKAFAALAFTWALAIGLLVITVALLVRYIMLILLLIASPLAYLAYAFPKAGGLAEKWWKLFLQYVFFGPIALFFLVLIIHIGSAAAFAPINSFVDGFLSMALTVGLLVAAAKFGKQTSVIGAAATLGYLTAQSKKLGVGAAKVAYVGTGARYAVHSGGDALDVGKSALRDIGKKYVPWAVPAKRDEKGKLKPGETSWVQKTVKQWIGPQGKKYDQAKAAQALGPITAANVTNSAISAPMLSQGHLTDALLGPKGTPNRLEKIKAIIEFGSMSQVKSLFQNKDMLRSFSEAERNELTVSIQSKTTTTELRVPPGSPPGTPPAPVPDRAPAREVARAAERLVDIFGQIDQEK